MREQLDRDFLANLVSMLRADIDGAIWLIDDEEEARFYQRCAHKSARIVPAPGIAFQLLEIVEGRGVEGVVASVRGLHRAECDRADVFRPHAGDVASLLLRSPTSQAVIEDVCGGPWVMASEKQIGPIRLRILWIARSLARLQKACLDGGVPPVDLNNLDEVLHWDRFEMDWDGLRPILEQSGLPVAVIEELRADAARGSDFDRDLLECDGMDALQVLAAATRLFRPRGLSARKAVDTQELLGMLRVAFKLDDIEADDVYWRMKLWERQNSQYSLLCDWKTLDPLGVVYDQRYWEADLLSILRFIGPTGSLAVLKMDLDNFKAVNDTLGHATGDEAIRLYCSIVRRTIGHNGDVYRRGGDEVVVLAPEVDPGLARDLAEQIRAAVEAEFRTWGAQRGLAAFPTCSVGLVLTSGDRTPVEIGDLMDRAQHQAKMEGKNRVVCLQ